MKVTVVKNVLDANDRLAQENRERFGRAGVRVINLMSGPGAGKTSLLECTVKKLHRELPIGVIEGDLQTSYDAERIERAGAQAVQINTDGGCHLDANLVGLAANSFSLDQLKLLIVENVGNLVCPAEFDVGEHAKVTMLSLTEGDDKPEKYPLMFKESQVVLINKMDLRPYVNSNPDKIEETVRRLNPQVQVFRLSCQSGEGLDSWCDWLRAFCRAER